MSTPERQATVLVFATTNGSLQNQPPAATATAATSRARKRGTSALLQDTYDESQSLRTGLQARRNMQSQSSRSTPCGILHKEKIRHRTACKTQVRVCHN